MNPPVSDALHAPQGSFLPCSAAVSEPHLRPRHPSLYAAAATTPSAALTHTCKFNICS